MEMNKFYRFVLYVLHADKHLLCGSRKYQFRESLEIPRERGISRELGGGGEGQTKKSSMERVWIFSGGTHLLDRSCQTASQTCCE